MKLRELNKLAEAKTILELLINENFEIGMLSFNLKEELNGIPKKEYNKIGNFELDIVAIHLSSYQIVILDHDQPSFQMSYIAESFLSFIKALTVIEDFHVECENNDDLWDDEVKMLEVAELASQKAGGQEYKGFYRMIFGV